MSESICMTPSDRAILEAIIERILPSGDGPGAREANVIGYIDWAIKQQFFERHRRKVITGARFVDSIAIQQWRKSFVCCSASEQDAVLGVLVRVPSDLASRLMATLVDITLVGFLCDPKYGGNRDFVGWNYIGFEVETSPS